MWKAINDAIVSQKLTCEIRSILNSLPLSREKFKCLDFFKELVPVEVILPTINSYTTIITLPFFRYPFAVL